ncbi:hypothetical protein VB796_21175 [Arcicella sp. LKC2W]|uniref:hypothetical protein n=1 Tax=Arcicella sp. LKC2W TaxID=2984198 RepID=UPI002B1EF6F8|nr:hypothetical protein [Arcicella sp. LKC2W]MEA5461593.1 hypothetical protein [Arcicella sp. LKC2W]
MKDYRDRLREYLEKNAIKPAYFVRELGFSNGLINKLLAKEIHIGVDKLENMLNHFDDLDPNWLLKGQELSTNQSATIIPEPTPQTKSTQENEELEEKKYVIKLQKQRIQELEEKIKAYETAKQTPQRSMAYTTNQ